MTVIGITGPTGAGKTTALLQLEKMGALIIDCDAVYHDLLERDGELRSALEARFGDLTGPHGGFDRKKLGTLVFGDPEALEDLNAIVRPHIARAVERLLERGRKEGRAAAAVDGITIIESGLADRCDTTVAVLAPVEERVRRICQREGISRQYAEARVSAQKQDEYFRANCEHILMNDCARVQEFAQRAQTLFEQILNGIS